MSAHWLPHNRFSAAPPHRTIMVSGRRVCRSPAAVTGISSRRTWPWGTRAF